MKVLHCHNIVWNARIIVSAACVGMKKLSGGKGCCKKVPRILGCKTYRNLYFISCYFVINNFTNLPEPCLYRSAQTSTQCGDDLLFCRTSEKEMASRNLVRPERCRVKKISVQCAPTKTLLHKYKTIWNIVNTESMQGLGQKRRKDHILLFLEYPAPWARGLRRGAPYA